MATPRLITPNGKTVELSRDVYKEFQKILRERQSASTRSKRAGHIAATYGKYASKSSLVQALLKERKLELAREEAKMRRQHG